MKIFDFAEKFITLFDGQQWLLSVWVDPVGQSVWPDASVVCLFGPP